MRGGVEKVCSRGFSGVVRRKNIGAADTATNPILS